MSPTDTLYIRELLRLSDSYDLYDELGVDANCPRAQLVEALERKRDWARQHSADPVAQWWTKHLARVARLLVHDEARPKRQRTDDLDSAIKGALQHGPIRPEMVRVLVRMGERRGLDETEVHARIVAERAAILAGGALDAARAALREAVWGATLGGAIGDEAVERIVAHGMELGIDPTEVRAIIDDIAPTGPIPLGPGASEPAPAPAVAPAPVKPAPAKHAAALAPRVTERVASSEELVTKGRWVPPHRRTAPPDPPAPRESEDEDEDEDDHAARRVAIDPGMGSDSGYDERSEGVDPRSAMPSQPTVDELAPRHVHASIPVDARLEMPLVVDARVEMPLVVAARLEVPLVARVPLAIPIASMTSLAAPRERRVAPPLNRVAAPVGRIAPHHRGAAPLDGEVRPPRLAGLVRHIVLSTVSIVGGVLYGLAWFLLANGVLVF